jgi:peptide/nickel transport system permease protein
MAPGGPTLALGFNPELTIQQREAMRIALGYDDPIAVQYLRWLVGDAPVTIGNIEVWGGRDRPTFDRAGNEIGTQPGTARGVLRGDFGYSTSSRRPVLKVIWERVPATVELGIISLLVGLAIGLPVGVLAAVYQGSWFDQLTRVMAVVVSSIPVFWLGLMLLLIFGATLGWLPMGNRFPLSFSGDYTFGDRVKHLILPVFTLSSFSIATFSRYMRASLLDVINQDYIRTAQAKGLKMRVVWFKHGMRNAMIPIATILGPSITLVISGAVLTETIYAWPGMGRLIVASVQQLDYPVIMAIVMLLALATIAGYLLSDILYAILDPRIRLN